jgi:alkylated DNA repair dioxygenase AlkB
VVAKRRSATSQHSDLFPTNLDWPAGFAYREDLISAGEEQDLLGRLENLPFKPFEFHGYQARRRVVSFGWRYDYSGATLREDAPIPPFLLPLRRRAADFAGIAPESLQQILINEYAPGAGIGWHRDKPMFDEIVAISLSSPCTLRLRRKRGAGWERATQDIQPRSAYLLRGASRLEWQHSIPPVDRLRYSVTFRNFVKGAAAGRLLTPPEAD